MANNTLAFSDVYQTFNITSGLLSVSTPLPSTSTSTYPKGTIAALVLAGVLGFLVIGGSLFFLFVARPRRRRARQARLERRREKEQESALLGVLNIAPPDFGDDMELGRTEASPIGLPPQRSSVKSGFTRWKREVEGGFGSLQGLGIAFRHSDSTGRRTGQEGSGSGPLSAKSSMLTLPSILSSKRSHRKGKKKAKAKSETSLSPSFAPEPSMESSAASFKGKDAGTLPLSLDADLISGVTSLSYMTSRPPPTAKLAPPYPVEPNDHHNLSVVPLQSVPRSVSRSTPSPTHHGKPNTGSQANEGGLYPPFSSPIPSPQDHGHRPLLAQYDWGIAQCSSEHVASDLGSAAARQAIHFLSPRTSTFAEPTSTSNRRLDSISFMASAESRISTATPLGSESSFLDVTSPIFQPIALRTDSTGEGPQIPPHNAFLDLRPTSPFVVDFGRSSSRKSRSSRHTASTNGKRKPDDRRSLGPHGPANSRSVFRLTPPSNPPTSAGHDHAQSQSESFLDFSGSSDASSRTRSTAPSEFSSHPQRQSRWSSVETMNLTNTPSGASISVTSVSGLSFPYPISLLHLPHHPEGHISSAPGSSILPQTESRPTDRYPARALRLSAFGPPSDTSVTDLHRHSTSTGDSHIAPSSSQLSLNPPLPEITIRTPPVTANSKPQAT